MSYVAPVNSRRALKDQKVMQSPLSGLTDRRLRQALNVIHTLAASTASSSSFAASALDQLPSLVESDLTTLSLCDLRSGTRTVFGRQAEQLSQSDNAIFDHYFRQHPLVRFHSRNPSGPTQRISDCLDDQRFRNSALYADYYARLGIKHVMALPLRIDEGTVISIVFNRGRQDFSNTERAIFEAIRLQLSALYRNVAAREAAGYGFSQIRSLAARDGWHIIRVDGSGRILDAGLQAQRLLREYFGGGQRWNASSLPERLRGWMSPSLHWGLDRPAESGEPFHVTRAGRRLTVHLVTDPIEPNRFYLLMKEVRTALSAEGLGTLPLTSREREVLALVAAGKSNPEIGTVLGISGRTVQKHLQHVFEKLGVETRTAAAMRALTCHFGQDL